MGSRETQSLFKWTQKKLVRQIRGKTAKKASTSIYSYMFTLLDLYDAFHTSVTCSLAADTTRHIPRPSLVGFRVCGGEL